MVAQRVNATTATTAEPKRVAALRGRIDRAPEVGRRPAPAAPAGAKVVDGCETEAGVPAPPEGLLEPKI